MLRKAAWVGGAAVALAMGSAAQQAPAAPGTTPAAAGDHAAGAQPAHASKQDRDKARKEFLAGAKDLKESEPRAAMEAFERAVALDPENRRYSISLDVAKQHMVRELVQEADKDRIQGHFDDARAAIAEAERIDPGDPMVEEHADEVTTDAGASRQAMDQKAAAEAPTALQPKPGVHSFALDAGEREVIRQVLAAYGIQPTLDDTVESKRIRFAMDDADFDQAQNALGLATDTFLVPLDPVRVLVAKDTKENHAKFDRLGAETIYLPGLATADLTETVTVAKSLFNLKAASAVPSQSALNVRGPVADLAALNATLDSLKEGRGELQLDVKMYEVDRTKATNTGAILPTQTTVFNVYSEAASLLQSNSSLVQQIISSGLAAPGDWPAILAILVASGQISNSILSQPFGVFGGGLTMTGVTYQGGSVNLQLNSSSVRSIDQLQMRVSDGEEGVAKVGERYPIETSSYSSLSPTSLNIPGLSNAGLSSTLQNLGVNLSSLTSAATEAVPQVQYQDIGLTLDVTPRMQGRTDVSLKFDLKLSSLAGSSVNGLPVLDNREYNATTSLALGQSAIMVSTLSRQESNALTGIPGLSDLPGFQATTNKDYSFDYGELAIVVTPHVVRAAHNQFAQKMVLMPRSQ
jgi:general secretion pathway protein D